MGLHGAIRLFIEFMRKDASNNNRVVGAVVKRADEIGRAEESSVSATAYPTNSSSISVAVETVLEQSRPTRDDLVSRLDPDRFALIQTVALLVDSLLNEVQAPSLDRNNVVEAAAKKDFDSLKNTIERLSKSAERPALLARMAGLVQDGGVKEKSQAHEANPVQIQNNPGSYVSSALNRTIHSADFALQQLMDSIEDQELLKLIGKIHSQQSDFEELQSKLRRVNDQIETLKAKDNIVWDVQLEIFNLERSNARPLRSIISSDQTISELANSYPGQIPDFWTTKTDHSRQCLARVCSAQLHWWEHQLESTRIGSIFPSMALSTVHKVNCIVRNGDYVVVLIEDGGRERWEAIDLPNSSWRAEQYFPRLFEGRQAIQVLSLKDGYDLSRESLNDRDVFRPRTNTVFVELTSPSLSSSIA